MDEGEEGRQGLGLIPTTTEVPDIAGLLRSCQNITEHKRTEAREDILPDYMSKSQAGFEENNAEEPVPFSDIQCRSKIMGQGLHGSGTENKAREVTQDKSPCILDKLCPVNTTAVEEKYYSASGHDLKKETDGDPATVEVGTTVSVPPTLSSMSKFIEEIATHTPSTLDCQQSLSQCSSSHHAQCPSDAVSEERYGNVSHHTLPLTETKKEKKALSLLLPGLEKQQKGKKGRPFKKKTIMKMAKLLAIAQEIDSEATEVSKVIHWKKTLTSKCKVTEENKTDKTPELVSPCALSDTSIGCNSTVDSIDDKIKDCFNETAFFSSSSHLDIPPATSQDTVPTFQVGGANTLMELNKPSKRKIASTNTTRKTEKSHLTVVSEMGLTTVTNMLSPPIEQALTQEALLPLETIQPFEESPANTLRVHKKHRKNTPQEKCNLLLSRDVTQLQSSEIKMEPKVIDSSIMAVKSNLRKISKQKRSSKISTQSGPVKEEPVDLAVTQHNLGAESDSMREIKNNPTTCTTAVGEHRELAMKDPEISGVKSIENVLKLKPKAGRGRPLGKKKKIQMAKLLAIAQEEGFQQDALPLAPIKSKEKKEKQIVTSNSSTSPSRRSSRVCKPTQNNEDAIPPHLALPISSEPIFKSEDASCKPVFPIDISSTEVSDQIESHGVVEDENLLKKSTKKKHIITSVRTHSPNVSDVKMLPEVVSTVNSLQKTTKTGGKNKGIGSKRKSKQILNTCSVSELSCINGNLQGDKITQINQNAASYSIAAPTLPTSFSPLTHKPRKCEVRRKTNNIEAVNVPLSDQTTLPVSNFQLEVQNLSASLEASLLPTATMIKSDSDNVTPRMVMENISKPKKARRKPSQKAKKALVITPNQVLGVDHGSPDMTNSTGTQMEAVTSVVDNHKPLKHIGRRKKGKEEALSPSSDDLLEQPNYCILQQSDGLPSEIKTESDVSHTTPIKATKKKTASKRKLPSKRPSESAKRVKASPERPVTNAKRVKASPKRPITNADQGGQSAVKNNDGAKHEMEAMTTVSSEAMTTVSSDNLKTVHKPRTSARPRRKQKQKPSNVFMSENPSPLTSVPLNQYSYSASTDVSLPTSFIKTESDCDNVPLKKPLKKTPRKRGQHPNKSTEINESVNVPTLNLSCGVENGSSEITSTLSHMDQAQDQVLSPPISNSRTPRRISKMKSTQEQLTMSLISDSTDHSFALQNMSPISPAVPLISAQGQITELVTPDCLEKKPNKKERAPKKGKLEGKGAHNENLTDEIAPIACLTAFVHKMLCEADLSPGNGKGEKRVTGEKDLMPKTDTSNPSDNHHNQLQMNNAVKDDTLVSSAPNTSIAVTPKRKKGGYVAKSDSVQVTTPCSIFSQDQQCIITTPEESTIVLKDANIEVPKPEDNRTACMDSTELLDTTSQSNKKVKDKKMESKTVKGELTEGTSVKEVVVTDLLTISPEKRDGSELLNASSKGNKKGKRKRKYFKAELTETTPVVKEMVVTDLLTISPEKRNSSELLDVPSQGNKKGKNQRKRRSETVKVELTETTSVVEEKVMADKIMISDDNLTACLTDCSELFHVPSQGNKKGNRKSKIVKAELTETTPVVKEMVVTDLLTISPEKRNSSELLDVPSQGNKKGENQRKRRSETVKVELTETTSVVEEKVMADKIMISDDNLTACLTGCSELFHVPSQGNKKGNRKSKIVKAELTETTPVVKEMVVTDLLTISPEKRNSSELLDVPSQGNKKGENQRKRRSETVKVELTETTSVVEEKVMADKIMISDDNLTACLTDCSELFHVPSQGNKKGNRKSKIVKAELTETTLVVNADEVEGSSDWLSTFSQRNQRVGKGKRKCKSVKEELIEATSVLEETMVADNQTAVTNFKKKKGRPLKKSTLLRMAKEVSCGQKTSLNLRESDALREGLENQKQNYELKETSKRRKINNADLTTTLKMGTRSGKAVKNEDVVNSNKSVSLLETNLKDSSLIPDNTLPSTVNMNIIKQEQDNTSWETAHVSSKGFLSQTSNVSIMSLSSDTIPADNGRIQGIQQVSCQLIPPPVKPPTKAAGGRKKRRTNKTGWVTKVKSKRPPSKMKGSDTVEVLVQSTNDNTGLLFNSSLCNSLSGKGAVSHHQLNDNIGLLNDEQQTEDSTSHDTPKILSKHGEVLQSEQEKANANQVIEQTHTAMTGFDQSFSDFILLSNQSVEQEKECGAQDLNMMTNNNRAHARLQQHPSARRRTPISCHFCGRSFRHISAYTVHRRIHTGERPYRCQKCGKSFALLSKLNLHANIHKLPKPMQCPCCVSQFPNKDELIAHFKTHIKGTKKSRLNDNMRNGGETQLSLNGNKSLRCTTCFKDFFNRAILKIHLQTHTEEKPFTCKVCGKMFHKLSSFNVHEKTHWPVKPYACSVCGKGFVQLRELKTHSHMHSGEMPFFCAHCGHAFSNFISLRTHQVSKVCSEKWDENDENKVEIEGFLVKQGVDGQINTPMYFKCQICKLLYQHWCQYILHLQTHTNNNPYLCEICGQQYDQVPELCVHCQVCCKSSGEKRACNSSLSEILQEPLSLHNDTPKPQHDLHPNDNQEMVSDDNQHPQCKVDLPLPPLMDTMEEDSPEMLPQSPNGVSQLLSDGLDILPLSPSDSVCANAPPSSPSVMSCGSIHPPDKQLSKFRSRLLINHAPCDRYSCGQCGKAFNQWNKLWLHQGLHRQEGCCFSCTQCKLEFRFFGSYRDHMQEHAAQRPYACPLCPKTFVIEENLNTHLCVFHTPCDGLKCDTCGKSFTSLIKLVKHSLLHRGASSHYCLLCNLSFTSNRTLQDHLKAHKARLDLPLPKEPMEPLLFPYPCRNCEARFTTTDLLQAHQICHLIERKKRVTSIADVVSISRPSKPSNKPRQGAEPCSPQQKRTLPVTKRNNLYRYPHPDCLYVVPNISCLQPPVMISDTEEDPQDSLSSNLSAHTSHLPQSSSPTAAVQSTVEHERTPCTPEPQTDTAPKSIPDFEPPSPCALDMSPLQIEPPQSKGKSTDDDGVFIEASTTVVIPRHKEQENDATFECADCLATFIEVSELHEHYLHHARGV